MVEALEGFGAEILPFENRRGQSVPVTRPAVQIDAIAAMLRCRDMGMAVNHKPGMGRCVGDELVADPDQVLKILTGQRHAGSDAGMDEEATKSTISTFIFPPVDEQLGEKWLGGGAQDFMLGVAEVFKSAGSIPSTRDTYEGAVDASHLSAAQGQ